MTESKKKYKKKILRKYIEIYPTDCDIIDMLDLLERCGFPFQKFAKMAIKAYIEFIRENK